MRWFWIDRYTEFVSGERATAVKNVTLSEEQVHDHFHGYPIMPNSLILEGMAQTAGLLVNQWSDFRERVVLAKFARSTFYGIAVPGDTLTYRATVEQIKQDGAMVQVTSHIQDRLQAETEIFFAHLAEDVAGESLFEPDDFLSWLRSLKIFEVGVYPDGSKIKIPPNLLPSGTDG